jgi:hypothetical protein
MTRTLLGLDRLLVLVVGLALVALGLLAVDWQYHLLFSSYDDTVRTGAAEDVVTTAWWPWVLAVAGVLLGLLGVWWLLAHLRREASSTTRLSASDETGRLEVDVRSVATAAAAHLGTIAPVVDPSGTVRSYGATTLVELRGRVDPAADVEALTEAVATTSQHVAAAFPDDRVECRVVLDAPQRRGRGRTTRVRVR